MTSLEALDPGRVWRKRSVDNHLSRLRDRGLIRRLKRSRKTNPAVSVRAGVEVEPVPFEGLTLPDVIAAVLSGKSMNQTELAVAMLEAGYETTMNPKAFLDAVGVELRKNGERFHRDGNRWTVNPANG